MLPRACLHGVNGVPAGGGGKLVTGSLGCTIKVWGGWPKDAALFRSGRGLSWPLAQPQECERWDRQLVTGGSSKPHCALNWRDTEEGLVQVWS